MHCIFEPLRAHNRGQFPEQPATTFPPLQKPTQASKPIAHGRGSPLRAHVLNKVHDTFMTQVQIEFNLESSSPLYWDHELPVTGHETEIAVGIVQNSQPSLPHGSRVVTNPANSGPLSPARGVEGAIPGPYLAI